MVAWAYRNFAAGYRAWSARVTLNKSLINHLELGTWILGAGNLEGEMPLGTALGFFVYENITWLQHTTTECGGAFMQET